MKKFLLLLVLLIAVSGFCQDYENNWRTVYKYELQGKTKLASKEVDKIYARAKRIGNQPQIIKTFLYRSKFSKTLNEESQVKIIESLKTEIKSNTLTNQSILNYIYADILDNYYLNLGYKIDARTPVENNSNSDFRTWSTKDFDREIENLYKKSLENKDLLLKTPLNDFSEIITFSKLDIHLNLSLYDFLSEKYINTNKFSNLNLTDEENSFVNSNLKSLFGTTEEFLKLNIEKQNGSAFFENLMLFQNIENDYQIKKNEIALYKTILKRLQLVHSVLDNDTEYIASLHTLKNKKENKYKNGYLLEYARLLNENASKKTKPDYKIKAVALLDSIIKSNGEPFLMEANILKQAILSKKLNLQHNEYIIPNEKNRALVNFQNIDSIYGEIYKIPLKQDSLFNDIRYHYRNNKYIDRDSLVVSLATKNKAYKSFAVKLPNKNDYFQYSTEFLYPELETGIYLIVLKTNNLPLKENAVFSYSVLKASNLSMFKANSAEQESFKIFDKKTGRPIENAELITDSFSLKTNNEGEATYTKDVSQEYQSKDIAVIKDSDTLSFNYNRLPFRNTSLEKVSKFIAKTFLYTDRGIYRPGQKVYFKGILVQRKADINSVVPKTFVSVKIVNASNQEVYKKTLETNDYGSFSDEFQLPTEVLTGTFTISASRALDFKGNEKQEAFWNNIYDITSSDIFFKVEEYKRPKFEVSFDSFKDVYAVNQNVKIKGNAFAFAGSTISNAKVLFTVKRIPSYQNLYFATDEDYNYHNGNEKQIANGEIKTDEKGNFEFDFIAAPDTDFNESKLPIFKYVVKATVTDINGETQSATSTLNVGYHSLVLSSEIPNVINTKDNASVTLKSSNLNAQFIPADVEMKIYKLKSPDRILRNRNWKAPEIQTIDNELFKELFPHEPINEEDKIANWENENLVISKVINTKDNPNFSLTNLKNWASGNYKIHITSVDKFGKKIENTNFFKVSNDADKKLADNQIFSIEVINNYPQKDGFVEVKLLSSLPLLYVDIEAFYNSEKVFNKSIKLENGNRSFKIPIEKNWKQNLKIATHFVWDGNDFNQNTTVFFKEEKENLEIETVSLRSKIEPGSKEKWSFSIKNKKPNESEILASMYDSSLDEFLNLSWTTHLKLTEYKPNNINYRNDFGMQSIKTMNFSNLNTVLPYPVDRETDLNWFGFSITNQRKRSFEYSQFLHDKNIQKNAKNISGVVSDNNGPLEGVTVTVAGTQRYTQTDYNGEYNLKVNFGETISFTYLGMKEKFVIATSQILNVNMLVDEEPLSEVVAIGYSMASKAELTSAVATYRPGDVDDMLMGQASGVQVTSDNENDFNYYYGNIYNANDSIRFNSGTKKALVWNARSEDNKKAVATFVKIKGVGTISEGNSPLYIIDGEAISEDNLNNLDLDAIVSTVVLKKEEAVAIYGNNAKNGAVIITTKASLQELLNVQTRKKFNETAFFFPQIKADKDGNFSFNFTSPEALTQWKLRVFAHDKKANSGYFEHKIITQKDFMIAPNLPRFLREKDSITITTKISNLTSESKSGIAMLQLFDAVSIEPIDKKMLNLENAKPFKINARGNTTVSWKIYVPEGLQGVQYKIVAKAGNFSDGEENILPVLTNNMLVTESIPVWVRENSSKEYTFENLKNNTSTTLRNQQLTFEYTSNPTWLAIQALPYLMEYEHECAEQTFARYYANALASEILNSNPKIAAVFESWKKTEKPLSKLEQNEELKAVLLAETPWIADALSEEEKKKNLATLFDLQKMKESQKTTFDKLTQKQKASGGFAWFDGGEENEYVTRHIISGLGHLRKLTNKKTDELDQVSKNGIDFLDQKFLDSYIQNEAKDNQTKLVWKNPYKNLHYLYARSLYFDSYPMGKNLSRVAILYVEEIKKNWLQYSLYEKGLASLVLSRFEEKETAKKILENLRQTSSNHEDWGMYWIENKAGWYWYQAPIETQALLIEAFAEIENDKKSVDAMKVWLLKNKQNKNWPTTKATTEAVYALLMQGTDWISVKDKTVIKIGSEKTVTNKLAENEKEAGTGYIKMSWKSDEITKETATVSVNNKSVAPGFGGFYWQYFEDLDKIKSSQESPMTIEKELYLKATTSEGNQLQRITSEKSLKIGDLVTVRLVISAKEEMEYVHLKDMRASCFEPIDVLSKYKWQDGLGYYQSTKDVATHFFFDKIKIGKFVLEYDIRVNNLGDFSNGITTIQSMYAPEFSSHTKGIRVKIKE